MANSVSEVLLTTAKLNIWRGGPDASGAIVDFWGTVRPLEQGDKIEGIEYEAHEPMAEHQLRLIAEEATSRFALHLIVIHHRLGFVAVNEASVFVRTASQHRGQAFQANQWAMDQLKTKVPIWKRPRFGQQPRKQYATAPAGTALPQ